MKAALHNFSQLLKLVDATVHRLLASPDGVAFALKLLTVVLLIAGLTRGLGWAALAAAVLAGCLLWYFILNHYVARYHRLFRPKTFQRIFLALALVLAVFSVLTAVSIFVPLHI